MTGLNSENFPLRFLPHFFQNAHHNRAELLIEKLNVKPHGAVFDEAFEHENRLPPFFAVAGPEGVDEGVHDLLASG